jgi:hypothetical protein
MGNVRKEDRADGTDILKLNLVGLGLQAIGEIVGCDQATVSVKLKEMGVPPNDTRRNFMAAVYNCLTEEEREWLADTLYTSKTSVKDFVIRLLKEQYRLAPAVPTAEPTPLPPPISQVELAPGLTFTSSAVSPEVPDEAVFDLFAHGTGVVKVTAENGKPKLTTIPVRDLFSE